MLSYREKGVTVCIYRGSSLFVPFLKKIGQNQARVKFFLKNPYLGEGTFVFIFYVVNLALGKFGPHPWGSYGGGGDLSFYVGGKGR